jgi:hypothetical protein
MILSLLLAAAQPTAVTPALSDEFDGAALSETWTRFDQAFGWPDKVKALAVADGVLRLEPRHSAWVRDAQAPFLFKTVQGDFDIRARVRVRSASGEVPGGTWSLGGLMARVPNGQTSVNWQPRSENWHFVTTGVAHERGRVLTETKGTYNSYSSLKLRPFRSGWVELRLVRVGMALFALVRGDEKEPWQVRDRWYRMHGSPVTQVGLIAYTTSDETRPGPDEQLYDNRVASDAKVDMVMDVDWVRFTPVRTASSGGWASEVGGANRLTDPNLSEAEVLELLGS